jgi:hypothetical protein
METVKESQEDSRNLSINMRDTETMKNRFSRITNDKPFTEDLSQDDMLF